jgi:uncharacterized membrane protein YhdT
VEILLFWIVFSAVAGVFAGTKGRSAFGWFFLSCVVSPVITIILIAIMPRVNSSSVSLESKLNETKNLLDRGVITQEE